jgi:uncharacterized protein
MSDFASARPKLLELQAHDTALDQLRHRKQHLPEQIKLNECEQRLVVLERELAPTRAALEALGQRAAALETQISQADTKIETANRSLYSGAVTASRELQALEADIASLKKHRSELEDQELEILVEREPYEAVLEGAAERRNAIDQEAMVLRVAATEATITIDSDTTRHVAERAALAGEIDETSLSLYESVRAQNRGVGIARIEHGACMSCHLTIPSVELDRISRLPESTVIRCEECNVILIP